MITYRTLLVVGNYIDELPKKSKVTAKYREVYAEAVTGKISESTFLSELRRIRYSCN